MDKPIGGSREKQISIKQMALNSTKKRMITNEEYDYFFTKAVIHYPECAFLRTKMGFFFFEDHRAIDPS